MATAYLELFASGSGQEEYTNVPDEYKPKLDPQNRGDVTGKGPFREVQVWIDNLLAGVAYPLPVIYTGGILLSWWRPIAAIGQGENGSINPDWIFSASVFASLDPSGARTTGKILTHSTDSKTTVGAASAASTPPKIDPKDLVSFVTHSFRYLSISSTVVTGTGGSQVFKTEQDMTFINQQSWLPGGAYQSVVMTSQGRLNSNRGGRTEKIDDFRFPLNLTLTSVASPSKTTIVGHLNHQYDRTTNLPFCSGLGQIKIETTQDSVGQLVINPQGRAISGIGMTKQHFNYQNAKGGTYTRDVQIYNSTKIIRDEESGTLLPVSKPKVFSESSLTENPLAASLLSTGTPSANTHLANGVSLTATSDGKTHLDGDDSIPGVPSRNVASPRSLIKNSR
ncbi:hypothetical protein PCANC_09834 [Puccinia coronata f. sp. avenae]|uniref:Peptide N-acetyl-beta-D-glucosaminyl asparaginase amidase A N-terminal domain-containing protein n=1 Tax=Puccinia coronata f. sp. avenae TaxID=200324 RepID=A0A2N5T0G8_9BASI|nr:hypothetical protein PCANC_09834 [Puccinia coronata f. sp. avenae]